MLNSNRPPLAPDISETMAIADVVYVESIGLCSHQPTAPVEDGYHRMADVRGTVHTVKTTRLFLASADECREYWQNVRW